MPRKKAENSPNATVFYRNVSEPEAVVKREVSTKSQVWQPEDIIIYGDDNALPLRIAKAVNQSPAAMACINTIAKYIKGSKFSNTDLMNLKIDKNGTTLWQLHTWLSDTLALFRGFAVNFKFDRQGKITNVYPLSFESCRLAKPDDEGYVNVIKYNPYYGTSEYKKDFTCEYHVYDPKEVLNQINSERKEFKGQVYYYGRTSPVYRYYPVPDYWSASQWIGIDGKIQEFHNENLENGFFQSVLMNVIGDPSAKSKNPKYNRVVIGDDGNKRIEDSKTVGEEFNEMMAGAFSGSKKAGTALALWSQNKDSSINIQAFPTTSNSDLFLALQDLTTKNITIATQVPGILANISDDVSLGGDGNEIQKAIELMQSRVVEEQQLLMQFYNETLIPNLSEGSAEKVEIINFNPVTVPVEIEDKFWEAMDQDERRDFIRKNVPGVKLKEAVITTTTPAPLTTDGQPAEQAQQSQQVNDALKGLKLSDINRMSSIVAKVANGKMTYDQAKIILQGYGLTDDQIDAWLVKPEET